MSASQDTLASYYDFWDKQVRRWARSKSPDQEFMPEPWWGWTPGSKEPLHSVVINLNPGQGGKLQTKECMNCMLGCVAATSYSLSMNLLREHLEFTERWHRNRRYRPIMLALGVDKKEIAQTTHNHLSIELLPNHEIENFSEELEKKASEIYEKVLCFAAEASKLIEAKPYSNVDLNLQNIVLMRTSSKHLEKISNALEKQKSDHKIQKQYSNSEYDLFNLENEKDLKDVLFVCIKGTRNNFPGTENLKKILKHIISIKNNKQ